MFTLGFSQRKYVYPTIMLFCLFILLMRYMYAAESVPEPKIPDRVKDDIDAANDVFRRNENDFINAAERFDNRLNEPFTEARLRSGESRTRGMTNDWRNSTSGFYSTHVNRPDTMTRYTDSRYTQERRRLDDLRAKEMNTYRDKRHYIQNRMSGFNRNSYEYDRLERELHALDRSHAEQERRFEREFRNMDANYSITRW